MYGLSLGSPRVRLYEGAWVFSLAVLYVFTKSLGILPSVTKLEFALQWLIDNQLNRLCQRCVLGQSFRLSVTQFLREKERTVGGMDISDWPCISGCL